MRRDMTAPLVGGYSDVIRTAGIYNVTVAYKVSSIGTNVVMRLEGSLDGVNYYVVSDDVTHTANGTYAFRVYEETHDYMRLMFVSASAGTPVISDVKFAGAQSA